MMAGVTVTKKKRKKQPLPADVHDADLTPAQKSIRQNQRARSKRKKFKKPTVGEAIKGSLKALFVDIPKEAVREYSKPLRAFNEAGEKRGAAGRSPRKKTFAGNLKAVAGDMKDIVTGGLGDKDAKARFKKRNRRRKAIVDASLDPKGPTLKQAHPDGLPKKKKKKRKPGSGQSSAVGPPTKAQQKGNESAERIRQHNIDVGPELDRQRERRRKRRKSSA